MASNCGTKDDLERSGATVVTGHSHSTFVSCWVLNLRRHACLARHANEQRPHLESSLQIGSEGERANCMTVLGEENPG